MPSATELLKRLRGDAAVRDAQRQLQAELRALRAELVRRPAPNATAEQASDWQRTQRAGTEIGVLDDLSLELKQGTRTATWPQIVKSRTMEVRPLPIRRSSNFLAMGSCFVNEIRHHLELGGVTVYPRLDPETQGLIPDEVKATPARGPWDERVHYQNYTPFSIEQEIDVALGKHALPEQAVLQQGDRFWDPYRRGVFASSPEKMLEIRQRMNDAVAEGVREASVAILTLGSIEAFTLRDHGGFVPEFKAHLRNDVELYEPTLEDVATCVERIASKLLDDAGFEYVVLTVSPIPMSRTHRDDEVINQNCYAKAALRAAVENVVRSRENVLYFPSYEFVVSKGGFRSSDYTHVRSDVVAEITSTFLDALKS